MLLVPPLVQAETKTTASLPPFKFGAYVSTTASLESGSVVIVSKVDCAVLIFNDNAARAKKNEFFKSVPDEREAYSIVIPPPNVTGQLHLGHTLNNTLQDALIRKARLEGKNACWVPGTDHASIATENKVLELSIMMS